MNADQFWAEYLKWEKVPPGDKKLEASDKIRALALEKQRYWCWMFWARSQI